jgi:spore coat protein U-like protein
MAFGALAALQGTGHATGSCYLSSPTFNLATINPSYSGTTPQVSQSATINCSGFSSSQAISACLQIGAGDQTGSTLTQRLISDSTDTVKIGIYQNGTSTQIGTGSPYALYGPVGFTTNGSGSGTGTFNIGVSVIGPNTGAEQNVYQAHFSGTSYQGTYNTGSASSCSSLTNTATTGFMTVNGNVVQSCAATASALNFGSATNLSSPLTASSTITITCSQAGVSATVSLDYGQTGTGPTSRYMTHSSYTITYGIYQDSGYSLPWGQTAGTDTVSVSMLGATQSSVTAYGKVPTQSVGAAGTFADVVNVNISY